MTNWISKFVADLLCSVLFFVHVSSGKRFSDFSWMFLFKTTHFQSKRTDKKWNECTIFEVFLLKRGNDYIILECCALFAVNSRLSNFTWSNRNSFYKENSLTIFISSSRTGLLSLKFACDHVLLEDFMSLGKKSVFLKTTQRKQLLKCKISKNV